MHVHFSANRGGARAVVGMLWAFILLALSPVTFTLVWSMEERTLPSRQVCDSPLATSMRDILNRRNPSNCVHRSSCSDATKALQDHLAATCPVSDFYIQGWRWHTLSLVRESDRLAQAATALGRQDSSSYSKDSLVRAADYVVNFNLRGLHKIEEDLFFPWIVRRLSMREQRTEVNQALRTIIDELDRVRSHVRKNGVQLMEAVKKEGEIDGSSSSIRSKDWLDIAALKSKEISIESKRILDTADALLVPLIQRYVSESEQKAFNNRVIRELGLLDSRLHLVGMHEATLALPKERSRFQQIIPKFPQSMIPRWKRLLYDPKVEVLKRFADG